MLIEDDPRALYLYFAQCLPEQATDGSLPSENWALNMEICDIINSSTDGPKDAVKAIRKRLTQSAGKNYTVVMYTLTVLETCVKNCGKSFHILVCSKEFISELVSLLYLILLGLYLCENLYRINVSTDVCYFIIHA